MRMSDEERKVYDYNVKSLSALHLNATDMVEHASFSMMLSTMEIRKLNNLLYDIFKDEKQNKNNLNKILNEAKELIAKRYEINSNMHPHTKETLYRERAGANTMLHFFENKLKEMLK